MLAVMLAAILLAGGSVMAGLLGKNTLFSSVSGTVVDGGTPVEGATVTATVIGGGEKKHQLSAQTGQDGSFSFAAITQGKSLLGLLPSEFVAGQELTVEVNGQSLVGWQHTKRDPKPGSETDGQPFVLICDIAEKPDFRGNHYGICRLAHE